MAKKTTTQAQAPAAAAIDLFAPVGPTAVVAEKKGKKSKDKEEVELGVDLDVYAALKVLTDNLATLAATYEENVKNNVIGIFTKSIIETGKRPESFRGTGKVSEASCEIRNKASNYDLGDETVKVLTDNNIPFEQITEQEEVYAFNPAVLADPAVRDALNRAIQNDPVLKGKSIVVHHPAKVRRVVADNTIAEIAKVKDPAQAESILRRVCNFAVGKCKLGENTMEAALDVLKENGLFGKKANLG